MTIEFLLVFLLIVANGVFAMSEAAMISARQARLQQRAEAGDRGAKVALELAAEPNRFLSTVQIGISLIGILSGAIGGSTLAKSIQPLIEQIPFLAPQSEAVSVVVVVLIITYLSLVVGELVPKRLAINNAEAIAARVAPPMQALSRVAAPIVALLSISTRGLLVLLGVRASDEPPVTEEEVRIMIAQGAQAGVFEFAEQEMVENIFRLADWRANAVMTPYTEVVLLDLDDPIHETIDRITRNRYVAYPVFQGDQRNLVGIVLLEDLWAQLARGQALDLRAALKTPLFIPESALALHVLEQFRQSGQRLALIIDEHSSMVGVTTPQDILEAVVGELPAESVEVSMIERPDGSWLVDGMLHIDAFEDYVDETIFPEEERSDYQTLGGFVMMRIGRIPQAGDLFEWGGFRYEVMDMDGRRVDKVLVMRLPETDQKIDDA